MSTRAARQFLLILAFLLVTNGIARAQDSGAWQMADGPVAFVTHLVADPTSPDFLFVFISNSVQRNPDQTQTTQGQAISTWAPYFSVDAGEHWQPASNDLAGFRPTAVTIVEMNRGTSIWVGTEKNGVWQSKNGGRTWWAVEISGLKKQKVISIAQDARQRLHLLTVDNQRNPVTHLYTSSDEGQTWHHHQLQSASNAPTCQLITDPIDGNQLYLLTQGHLLLSADAGFSWHEASLPAETTLAGDMALAPDPTQRGRLYLVRRTQLTGGQPQLLSFVSVDSGKTWQAQPTRFISLAGANATMTPVPLHLAVDPLARQRLLLSTNAGLWLSEDGGKIWRAAGTALAGVPISGLTFNHRHKGRWIAAGAGGIWRTDSAGGTWQDISPGLPPASSIRQLLSFTPEYSTLLALNRGFLPDDTLLQPLWRSEDGGQSWMPARRGLEGLHLRQLIPYPHDAQTAFILTDEGIARTDNQGKTWIHRPVAAYPLALAADPAAANLYLATAQGLQRSMDKGDSWTPVFEQGSVVAVTVDVASVISLVTYDDAGQMVLWQSQNLGLTWHQVAPLPEQGAITLTAHPQLPNFLILTAPWQGIYVSVDGGLHWSRRDTGIPVPARWRGGAPETPAAPNILALFIDPETGLWWASRDGGGLYRSRNNGSRWEDAAEDLGDTLIYSFARGPQDVVAGSSNLGLLRRQASPPHTSPPADIDARIEIFWPHDFAPVSTASRANLGLRLYRNHSLEPPPCAWTPNVLLFVAKDAQPMRRLGMPEHRVMQTHPFPFWTMNDVDVTWANEPGHQLIYMAQVAPGQATSNASVWIHADDARTFLPNPPSPTALAAAGVSEIDGVILRAWPHDAAGHYAPPETAPLVNITATLFQRETQLALMPADLPPRVWLVGALDNQIGRRLAVGKKRSIVEKGLRYTLYDFNDIDVSLARNPEHHWTFWLEAPEADLTSNVWVHGTDARTIAPQISEPIVGCQP